MCLAEDRRCICDAMLHRKDDAVAVDILRSVDNVPMEDRRKMMIPCVDDDWEESLFDSVPLEEAEDDDDLLLDRNVAAGKDTNVLEAKHREVACDRLLSQEKAPVVVEEVRDRIRKDNTWPRAAAARGDDEDDDKKEEEEYD